MPDTLHRQCPLRPIARLPAHSPRDENNKVDSGPGGARHIAPIGLSPARASLDRDIGPDSIFQQIPLPYTRGLFRHRPLLRHHKDAGTAHQSLTYPVGELPFADTCRLIAADDAPMHPRRHRLCGRTLRLDIGGMHHRPDFGRCLGDIHPPSDCSYLHF